MIRKLDELLESRSLADRRDSIAEYHREYAFATRVYGQRLSLLSRRRPVRLFPALRLLSSGAYRKYFGGSRFFILDMLSDNYR